MMWQTLNGLNSLLWVQGEDIGRDANEVVTSTPVVPILWYAYQQWYAKAFKVVHEYTYFMFFFTRNIFTAIVPGEFC